jgi:hypothetical protein
MGLPYVCIRNPNLVYNLNSELVQILSLSKYLAGKMLNLPLYPGILMTSLDLKERICSWFGFNSSTMLSIWNIVKQERTVRIHYEY